MTEPDRHTRRAAAPARSRDVRASPHTPLGTKAVAAARLPSLSTQRNLLDLWRREVRPRAVSFIAARTQTLRWSPALLDLVLEELAIDDLFVELLGTARTIPRHRYAQALAVAIALRHSWRPDTLASVANRLGLERSLSAFCRGMEFHSVSARAARTSPPTKTIRRRLSAAEKGPRS